MREKEGWEREWERVCKEEGKIETVCGEEREREKAEVRGEG